MTNKTKIRVVFAKNPPDAFSNCPNFPTLEPSYGCPFPGSTSEILSMLMDYLNYDIEPIIVDNQVGLLDWGTLTNDTWKGVLGYLENGTADTACLMYQLTATRGQYFSPSYPTYNVQPVYAVKSLENQGPGLWSVFTPYRLWTWLAILAIFFIELGYFVAVAKLELKMFRRKHFDPYEIMWNVLRMQLDKEKSDHYEHFHTIGGKINLIIFQLLQVKLILDLYTGLLLTSLLNSNNSTSFNNADDMIRLIASGKYKLITNYIGNWYFDDLRNSNDSHFLNLRAAIKNNPVVVVGSVAEALNYVDQGGYIYPIQQDSLAMQMSKEKCNLIYVSEGLPQIQAMFMFQMNSSFLPALNKAIYENGGFIERTFNKYFMNGFLMGFENKSCMVEEKLPDALRPLDLYASFAIFLIALFGFALAVVALGFEIYFNWHWKIIERQKKIRKAAFMLEPFHLLEVSQLAKKKQSNNKIMPM